MRTAIGLLEIFVVAIILAFAVTFTTGTPEIRLLALGLITPITVLSLAFIYYCRKGSYGGASILGAFGVLG